MNRQVVESRFSSGVKTGLQDGLRHAEREIVCEAGLRFVSAIASD
jgi:hypothetical protein